jgi:hypothetical protein
MEDPVALVRQFELSPCIAQHESLPIAVTSTASFVQQSLSPLFSPSPLALTNVENAGVID